jgi:DNA repair exonuclease SbcCD ATPase subunit
MAKEETGIPGAQKAAMRLLSLNGSQLIESIRSEIEKENGVLRKFLGLVESLRDIVPEEDKRYHAALESLSQAIGVSKEDIVRAADRQLSELENQRKSFALSLVERRAEMKVLLARANHIKSEASRLQEEIHRLEEEEKRILAKVKAEEAALRTTEENFTAVVEKLEKEIGETRRRITRYLLEGAPPPDEPLMHPHMEEFAGTRAVGEDPDDFGDTTLRPAAEKTSVNTKTCPNCQNQMDWYDFDKKWKCFVCAHEVD